MSRYEGLLLFDVMEDMNGWKEHPMRGIGNLWTKGNVELVIEFNEEHGDWELWCQSDEWADLIDAGDYEQVKRSAIEFMMNH